MGSNFTYGISGLKFISGQRISGNYIYGYTISCNTFKGPITAGGTTSPAGGKNYIQYSDGTVFDSEDSLTYDETTNTMRISGAISGVAAEFHTYKGGWSGSQIKSPYITGYIASSTATGRFSDSSNVNIKTSGSLHKLWLWSSNKSWYANSSNVRYRFPASSTAISRYADSSNIRYRFYPSSLGKSLMNFSANKSLYANSANVRFRFIESGGTKWVDLTDGGATTLHSHAGVNPAGSLGANIGSNFTYGISGVKFVSSQNISSNNIWGKMYYPVEYIIEKEGANYLAIEGKTRKINYTGTSPVKAIQYGLDNTPSGIVLLNTDITDLDGTISGGTRCIFDLGGHTINLQTTARNVYKAARGSKVQNGKIVIYSNLKNAYSGMAVILLRTDCLSDAYLDGQFSGDWSQMYFKNLWIRGEQLPSTDFMNSGMAVWCYASGAGDIYHVIFDNININYFKYGIRLTSAGKPGSLGPPGKGVNFINGNQFNNINGTRCNKFIWLEQMWPSCSVACNTFTYDYQHWGDARSYRAIYCNGDGNMFKGMTWDVPTVQTAIEFSPSSNGNYIQDYGITPTWYGLYGDSDSHVVDNGTHNTVVDNAYSKLYQEEIFTNYIRNPNTNLSTDDGLKIRTGINPRIYFYSGTNIMATIDARVAQYTMIHGGTAAGNGLGLYGDGVSDYPRLYIIGNSYIRFIMGAGVPVQLTNPNWLNGPQFTPVVGKLSKIDGGDIAKYCLKINANSSDTLPYIYLSGSKGIAVNSTTYAGQGFYSPSVSSSRISGQWTTPLYKGKPTAGISNCGQIIRTSGSGYGGTYTWVCVQQNGGSYEWDMLAKSSA